MINSNLTQTLAIFSRKLKKLRECRGLSQDRLAELAGIDRSYLSGCESGQRNPSVEILVKLASALQITVSCLLDEEDIFFNDAPTIQSNAFRDVPLPEGLTATEISLALQETQNFFSLIRHTSEINLSSIIQGNNFSGIVSNVFTRKLSDNSRYKEFSEQRYPDLMGENGVGLEVKASVNPWKGGEGHNGHSGWHIIICYKILPIGDIEFTQVEVAELIGFGQQNSDWKYLGSKRNLNDSQRTETYVTTNVGTAKLRDGSAYLRTDLIAPSNAMRKFREKIVELPIPPFSPFYNSISS